jgi:hypothetical protein
MRELYADEAALNQPVEVTGCFGRHTARLFLEQHGEKIVRVTAKIMVIQGTAIPSPGAQAPDAWTGWPNGHTTQLIPTGYRLIRQGSLRPCEALHHLGVS